MPWLEHAGVEVEGFWGGNFDCGGGGVGGVDEGVPFAFDDGRGDEQGEGAAGGDPVGADLLECRMVQELPVCGQIGGIYPLDSGFEEGQFGGQRDKVARFVLWIEVDEDLNRRE